MSPDNPADFKGAASQLAPEVVSRFRQALELGRWPDGRKVTPEQKQILMESVLLAEAAQGMPMEQRTGYIDTAGHKGRKNNLETAHSDLIHKES
ncbi:MAG: DUF1315 family protein [Hahellaceae bacterium]|nr:DUF1315 family protein [Hahellaceae bacterium]